MLQTETTMCPINIQDTTKVKLTYKGQELFKIHYGYEPRIDEDGFYEAPLWMLMHLFGPHIKDNPDIFEGGNVYVPIPNVQPQIIKHEDSGLKHQELVLISAYTGYLLVEEFSDVKKFCAELLGRSIWTCDLADKSVIKEIKEKCLPLIIEMVTKCNDTND